MENSSFVHPTVVEYSEILIKRNSQLVSIVLEDVSVVISRQPIENIPKLQKKQEFTLDSVNNFYVYFVDWEIDNVR